MKTALIISSWVSASAVGAGVSQFCMQRLGVNALVLPTVILGRHPGWGEPGGGPVALAQMQDMWHAIGQQSIMIDAVLTGYMSSPEQVKFSAALINELKNRQPDMKVLIDPVMGDHGRLYIAEKTAQKIISDLIPRADYVTPNRFELAYITGLAAPTLKLQYQACQALPCTALVTSVNVHNDIGALLHIKDDDSQDQSALIHHQQFDTVPHGGGDALSATFLAHILQGQSQQKAFQKAVSTVFEILTHAFKDSQQELPLIQAQKALEMPSLLPIHAADSVNG